MGTTVQIVCFTVAALIGLLLAAFLLPLLIGPALAAARFIFRLSPPPISKVEAEAIAVRSCSERGVEDVHPLSVSERLSTWRVFTNDDRMGGNVWVRIDKRTGKVMSWSQPFKR